MSQFNVSRVVDAIVQSAAANGAFVRAIVEAREECPKFNAEKVSVSIAEMLAVRVEAGEIEVQSARNYASYAKAMLECKLPTLIAACEEGYGIMGVLSRIRATEGKRSKAGRPAGKGKGKTKTQPKTTAPATPEGSMWKGFLPVIQTTRARCNVLHFADGQTLPSDELAQVQDLLNKLIVMIQRRKP